MWRREISVKAFLPLTLVASLYATDIQTLVSKSYDNNPTLKKLELQIKASDYDIKNSDIYKNPILSIGLNDINLDEPTDRALEPMQTQYISISQEITDSDKLEQKSKIAYINKEILQIILKEKKDQISKKIYTLAYEIQELEEKIKLNKQKILNIKEIKNYHDNHIQHKQAFQISLQNDLMIDTINLSIQIDLEKIEQKYVKLSELVNDDVKNIENVNEFIYDEDITSHKLLQIEELNIKKANVKKELARENESSDFTLSAGYYQREKFDDYVNIAIKMPLNIYKKESNELHKSFKQIEISRQRYEEVKNALYKKYKIELSKNRLSKNSIKYIDQILAHLEKEKELIINQNKMDSVIGALAIENKIIDEKKKRLMYQKQLKQSKLELAYLTSTIKR